MKQTNFQSKLAIMSHLWVNYRNDEDWGSVCKAQPTGFAFAWGLYHDYFFVQDWEGASDDVISIIDDAWLSLIGISGVEDTGFEDWNDFIDKVNA
jgi:hypothetical protein